MSLTGPTHRVFSVAFALGGAYVLTNLGRIEVNPVVATPVYLMTARYGALMPDVDHNWNSVADKTFPNRILNVFIHLTGGRHRSWQTHSLDIYFLFLGILWFFPVEVLYSIGWDTINVGLLLLYGFMLGWGSHLFSDMLTPRGVRIFCWCKFTLHLVPKWAMFATNSRWEDLCYVFMKRFNVVLGLCYTGWLLYWVGLLPWLVSKLQVLLGFV